MHVNYTETLSLPEVGCSLIQGQAVDYFEQVKAVSDDSVDQDGGESQELLAVNEHLRCVRSLHDLNYLH